MPRLLLVDDNPSIHKIAETLLASSPIQLVCVDSAAAALDRVNRGELFDVALVDTSMAGIDGWTLVERLRQNPSTARMPIAMMAGVLDTVDPERIKEAPIQGFLKKPVELRELGDRIARLLETPVPLPEPSLPKTTSPFATMPATRLEELPEFRQKTAAITPEAARIAPGPAAPVPAAPMPAAPVQAVAAPAARKPEADLLELTEEDLYPEAAPAEETLDLEELDLENLRGLSLQPETSAAAGAALAGAAATYAAEPTPPEGSWPAEELDAISTLDRLPEPLPAAPEPAAPELDRMVELPDLGAPAEEVLDFASLSTLPEIEEMATIEELPLADVAEELPSFTPPLPPLEESLDWSDDSDSLLPAAETLEAPPELGMDLAPDAGGLPGVNDVQTLKEEELDLLDVSMPELVPPPVPFEPERPEAAVLPPSPPAAGALAAPALGSAASAFLAPSFGESVHAESIVESALLETAAAPAEEPQAAPAPSLPDALGTKELLAAMMADPVLMDALAKAVVARLGDQALREIAWEVMPELAERLPRS